MMKKMYNQPNTDVLAINTARMMQDLTVSVNESGTPSSGGSTATAGVPGRRGDIIP